MDASNPQAKPDLKSLVQIKDRISFLYVERCFINRRDSAITVTDKRGTVMVPSAALSVLMLGPGSNITHRAVALISDAGASIIWVGEEGVRYYAHGRTLSHSSSLLLKQAELVTNTRKRLNVARKMYEMRFLGEDVSRLTMAQLRGREGARVRKAYREASKSTGVPWNGREYDPDNYQAGSTVNRALSSANICLYGLAHAVICALGLAPGLGFVHTGHDRSFVYDIADLYKAETAIPIAFELAAQAPPDLDSQVRRAMRSAFSERKLLEQMVRDIHYLLNEADDDAPEAEVLRLWDEKEGYVQGGVSYGRETEEAEELYESVEESNGILIN